LDNKVLIRIFVCEKDKATERAGTTCLVRLIKQKCSWRNVCRRSKGNVES